MEDHIKPFPVSLTPDASDPRVSLDDAQLSAISQQSGPVVVLGDAGSGKTTVVVERAAHLVASSVPKEQILLLALSRANADELRMRLSARLGKDAPTVMTVHAFSYGCVRRHYREAGYQSPPRWATARETWQQLARALDRDDMNHWRHYRAALGLRTSLALINDLVTGAAGNDLDPTSLRGALLDCHRGDLVEFAGFVQRYQALIEAEGLLDAEGAVLRALRLLETSHPILRHYRNRYPHLLVDEFEQATYAQSRLICLLAAEGLFVAGNPEQATNSYRGGSPAYLRRLERAGQARLFRLETVHRGGAAIQSAWRRVLSGAGAHPGDSIATGGVAVMGFPHQKDEVTWLVGKIVSLVRSGTAPAEIAVLFRQGSDPVARELSNRLSRLGLPLQAMAGSVSVASDPMVLSGMDVLRFLGASSTERNALFLRLLASPLGGLTPSEVRSLRRLASQLRQTPLSIALTGGALEGLPSVVAASASDLARRLLELESLGELPPDELLWRIWAGFPAFASQSLSWSRGSPGDTVGCPAAFRTLIEEVSQLLRDTPSSSTPDILRLFDSGHFRELPVALPQGNRTGIRLATIHEARGKEWRYLFLPNVVEDVYPLRRSPIGSLAPILLRARDGQPELPRERHLAEERRLLGVAMSRATEGLWMSYSAVAFDGTSRLVPSRYLQGLEPASTETAVAEPEHSIEDVVSNYRRRLWHLDALLQAGEASPADRVAAAGALHGLARLETIAPDTAAPSRWWDLVDESRGAAPPNPDGALYLSASRLAAYRDCPMKYKFAHHIALEDGASDAMTLGSLLHSVLEEYHRPGNGHRRSRELLQQLLEGFFDESSFSSLAIARQVRRRASQLLDLYFPLYGWHGPTLAVERRFRFRLGPHIISGVIDRIDRLSDGSLELIDYKTGGPMSQADARDDLQLALYELAFHHDPALAGLGQPSIVTYLYPKGISEKLAAKLAESGGPPAKSTRGRGDGKRSNYPTEEGREKLLSRIQRYSRGILDERFPSRSQILHTWPDLDQEEAGRLQKGNPCRMCGFQWLCPEMERGISNG